MRKTATEYVLPVYWASYLVNGDASGLEEGEQREIDSWLDWAGCGPCMDMSGDSWFQRSNDANYLGGDVAHYTFALKH